VIALPPAPTPIASTPTVITVPQPRTPPRVTVLTPLPVTPAPTTTPVTPASGAPSSPVRSGTQDTSGVTYIGYVATPDERIAVLRVQGEQQQFVEGERIPDTDLTVEAVTPTGLTLRQGNQHTTLPLQEPE
jgi:hypothetical protein